MAKKGRGSEKARSAPERQPQATVQPLQWRPALRMAAYVAIGAFLLYAVLAARDVMFGDGEEFTAAAVLNGVAHPPGYPLWILLGHLASLVPVGSLAYRVNLTSCLYHALTVASVYLSGYVLTRRQRPALFGALVLALGSSLFVSWSLQAEVFALNDLFAAAIVLLCLVWIEGTPRASIAVALGALVGLGISNHQSLMLLMPIVAWAAWCARGAFAAKWGWAWAAGGVALLPLTFALPYVHTLLVSPHFPGAFGAARTPQEIVWLIERRAYGSGNLATPLQQSGTMIDRLTTLLIAAGWPMALAAIGAGVLAFERRWRAFTVAALIVVFPLCAFCAVANLNVQLDPGGLARAIFSRFGLLPLSAVAPFIACGLAAWEQRTRTPVRVRRAWSTVAVGAVVLFGAVQLPQLSLAAAHGPRTLFTDTLGHLPSGAVVFTVGDAFGLGTEYFQTVEGMRPDVTMIATGSLQNAGYADQLRARINVPAEAVTERSPLASRDMCPARTMPATRAASSRNSSRSGATATSQAATARKCSAKPPTGTPRSTPTAPKRTALPGWCASTTRWGFS